ncbi:MAG: hypothetical protein ABFS05_00505 [Bacteroidota bacterium]
MYYKMAINKHTYEAYFLDYHEGRLTDAQTKELMAFIAANPDLKLELEGYEAMALDPDPDLTFKDKHSLRRSTETGINMQEETAIAYFEGDLAEGENKLDAKTMKLAGLYRQTKLHADKKITFPDPASLKKRIAIFPSTVHYAAAAVIIILMAWSGFWIFNPSTDNAGEQYVLISLDKHKIHSLAVNQKPDHLIHRAIILMKPASEEREQIKLSKMPPGDLPDHISAPAYYSSGPVLIYRNMFPSFHLMEEENTLAESSDHKTAAGRVISGFINKAKAPFSVANKKDRTKDRNGFSFWDVADLGVQGVNMLGDHDYTLVRKYNEKGNVKGVRLLGE